MLDTLPINLAAELDQLRPALALAAQEIYAAWEQDENGLDIEVGAGGICDQISEALSTILSTSGWDSEEASQEGDDHSYLIAHKENQYFFVNLPSSVYETGGGYSWKKIPNILIQGEDFQIWPTSAPEEI